MIATARDRALKLYDDGQIAPAMRVAGSESVLNDWLKNRKSGFSFDLPEAEPDKPSGRPKNGPANAAQAQANRLVYRAAPEVERSKPEIGYINRVFVACTKVAWQEFGVTSLRIQMADEGPANETTQSARACWVALVVATGHDIRSSEIAAALNVDSVRFSEIKMLHRLQLEMSKGYAFRHRRALKKASSMIHNKERSNGN